MRKPADSTVDAQHASGNGEALAPYVRFAGMIATSIAVMYLLTYTNVFSPDHIRFSEERAYMAVLMGSAMAVVMLGFMWGSMYKNTALNVVIVIAALLVGAGAFALSQTQALVGDRAYMKGMIPHHSIAILTSKRANLADLRVQDLAERIGRAQVAEIKEMDWLLNDIAKNGKVISPAEAAARPAPDF